MRAITKGSRVDTPYGQGIVGSVLQARHVPLATVAIGGTLRICKVENVTLLTNKETDEKQQDIIA